MGTRVPVHEEIRKREGKHKVELDRGERWIHVSVCECDWSFRKLDAGVL